MKTEEPRSAKARGSLDDAGVANGAGAPIAAEAVDLEAPSDGHSVALPPGATITRPVRSRLLRLVFWAVWFCLVPILGAFFVLWLLLPSGGGEPTGVLGAVQSFVGSQSVPVGIVIFTVLEVGVWVARQRLPLARHAYPPLRTDVAPEMRPSLDRAQALLDEAEMILSRYESGVAQKLTAKERDRVRSEMHALRAGYASLSTREREVMELVVAGLLNKQVGVELGISETTVKHHRGRMMKKMKAGSLADLVKMAGALHLH